jgi:adenosine deaminase
VINNFKKIELHVHLEGCVWESHKKKWQDSAVAYFPVKQPDQAGVPITFNDFLAILRSNYNYLGREEQYVDLFRSYLDYMQFQNIVYAEIQLNSALLRTFNISITYLLQQFRIVANQRQNCTIRFIIDLPWQFSATSFDFFIEHYDQYRELNVVGLSMGGDESLANPSEISDIFTKARKVGYKILVHAGETTSTNFAKNIVKELKPDRIGHGLSISEWFIHEKDNVFIIDSCLSSNLALGLIKNLNEHPFKKWLKYDNIIATLSTDDPAIFNTTLNNEYELANNFYIDFDQYLEKLYEYFIAAAFDKESVHHALYI